MTKQDGGTQRMNMDKTKDGWKIVMADTDVVEDYADIAREFLERIFSINYDECFISDESTLSDFAGCAVPEDSVADNITMDEYYDIGRKYTIEKVSAVYNLDVHIHDYLFKVFEQIKLSRTNH
jgi:hypothetical protein